MSDDVLPAVEVPALSEEPAMAQAPLDAPAVGLAPGVEPRAAWLFALQVYATVRILATVAALVGATGIPAKTIATPASFYVFARYPVWADRLIGVWERADAVWYIFLARYGYSVNPDGVVFMPAYVLLIRLVHLVPTVLYLEAALLVSNVATLVAFYLNFRLCASELGEPVARRATWLLALFPGSFFLVAPFTESLFLALALGALWCARQHRWPLAILCAAVLGVTRNLGVVIMLPLALEAWRQHREDGASWRLLAWVPLAMSGLVSYALYWRHVNGDALTFVHRQLTWDRHPQWPFTTLALGLHQAWQYLGSSSGAVYILEALSVLFVLLMLVLSIGRIRSGYAWWSLAMLLPPLCAPYPGRVLMSSMRFCAVLFPVFWVQALVVENPDIERAVLLLYAGLYALSVGLYVASQWMF